VIKIYLEGAESTGKSSLAFQLAEKFKAEWVPEYGRIYLETFHGSIDYKDVETIAETQVLLEKSYEQNHTNLLFIDASLVNTKSWFLHVYNRYPLWIDDAIADYKTHHFLLCDTDIPWVADGLRANGGQFRLDLQNEYQNCLIKNAIPFEIIQGDGEIRFENAAKAVKNYLATFKEYA
jgi:NadR type nicotinamide-nucleotide adenylyltransferase